MEALIESTLSGRQKQIEQAKKRYVQILFDDDSSPKRITELDGLISLLGKKPEQLREDFKLVQRARGFVPLIERANSERAEREAAAQAVRESNEQLQAKWLELREAHGKLVLAQGEFDARHGQASELMRELLNMQRQRPDLFEEFEIPAIT